MMKKLLGTSIVATLVATMAMADSHAVVRLGTEGAYPPFNFINDAGEVDGFEREVGDELCARAELTCEWVTNEWDSIIPNLVSGNYDVIMAGMSVTAERDEVIDFSENYTQPDPSSYLATSSDADIAGGIVAAQTGTIQAAHITSTGATLLEFATPEETVAAVKNGEADAVLADASFLAPVAESDSELLIIEGADVLIGGGVGAGVRESDPELRDKLTAAIQSMKADGSLNELILKWETGAIFE